MDDMDIYIYIYIQINYTLLSRQLSFSVLALRYPPLDTEKQPIYSFLDFMPVVVVISLFYLNKSLSFSNSFLIIYIYIYI